MSLEVVHPANITGSFKGKQRVAPYSKEPRTHVWGATSECKSRFSVCIKSRLPLYAN